MPRLPIPGSDGGQWGNILNEYLSVSHNADGSIKPSALTEVVGATGPIGPIGPRVSKGLLVPLVRRVQQGLMVLVQSIL